MWPGFGSAWGSVLKDSARSGLAHLAVAAKGGFGRTAAGAVWGAAAGAMYGGLSSNTSVLGGAMMGMGMGAGLARYGGAALRRARYGIRGIGMPAEAVGTYMGLGKSAAMGLRNQALGDYAKARVMARSAASKIGNPRMAINRGYSKIRGLFR